MNATVIPIGAVRPTNEIEELLIGAVLDLPDKLEMLDGLGLARDQFSSARIGLVWMIVRRLAERRFEVNAATVCSAGQRAGLLSDSDLGWLIGLESNNTLTKPQALQIADDVRAQARGRNVRTQLQAQLDLIDRGRFSPAHISGALEGIVQSLIADFAPDETAEGDLLQLNESWDRHEREGTSALLPTGIKVLDDHIIGLPSKLTFIAGEPGRGKTALLGSMIQAQLESGVIKPGERVGLFGLEDGTEWLAKRWISKGTGIPLADVGWKRRTVEQSEKLAETNAKIFPMLQQVLCYRRDTISADEMVRRAAKWVFQQNVKCIYVDHLGEVDHRDPRRREDYWQQVSETVRRLRNFAIRYSVPVVVLVHTTSDGTGPTGRGEGPPRPDQLAGGRALDRKARLIMGLWQKKQSLRCTFLKTTESGARDVTVEFERLFEAGLVTPDGGRVVDLRSEENKERGDKRANAREIAFAEQLARAELKAKHKAEEAAKVAAASKPSPPDQPMLLDVPATEKP